jgi:hypothetical protein
MFLKITVLGFVMSIGPALGETRTQTSTERGTSVWAGWHTRSGVYRDDGGVTLRMPDDSKRTGVYKFFYTIFRCQGPGASGCVMMTGHGDIPLSAVLRTSDTVALSFIPATTAINFTYEGPPVTVQLSVRKDGRRIDQVTGMRTDYSSGFMEKTFGRTTNYSAQSTVVVNGEMLPVSEAGWRDAHEGTITFFTY